MSIFPLVKNTKTLPLIGIMKNNFWSIGEKREKIEHQK